MSYKSDDTGRRIRTPQDQCMVWRKTCRLDLSQKNKTKILKVLLNSLSSICISLLFASSFTLSLRLLWLDRRLAKELWLWEGRGGSQWTPSPACVSSLQAQ